MNGEGASVCSLLHLGESALGKGEQGLGAVRNLSRDPGLHCVTWGKSLHLSEPQIPHW